MAELEFHDEIVEWMDTLDEVEWERMVVVIDRLATLGSSAPHAAVEEPRRRAVRTAVHARADGTTDHLPVHQGRRIILLTTFRKQRNNERNEITRARQAAADCAEQYP